MSNLKYENMIKQRKKLLNKSKKKKSFISSIRMRIFLFLILLLILLILGRDLGFYKYKDGSIKENSQQKGLNDKNSETSKEDQFTIITVREDKLYINETLISLQDLKTYLSQHSDTAKIKLIDDKAINRVFNEVKDILEEGKLAYMIE
jgi:hypothetical protein